MPDPQNSGVRRIDVHKDGTAEEVFIPADDPELSRLSDLIEGQLHAEIIFENIPGKVEAVDKVRLRHAAFKIAEEIDYYYSIIRKDNPPKANQET